MIWPFTRRKIVEGRVLSPDGFRWALDLQLNVHDADELSRARFQVILDNFISGRVDPYIDSGSAAFIRSFCLAHAKINGAESAREALSWVRGREIGDQEWENEKTDLEFLWPNIEDFGNPDYGW